MIYGKAILSPALRRRTITRKLSLFRERNGALFCRGTHFCEEEDGALVPAEGAKKCGEVTDAVAFFTASGQSCRSFRYGSDRAIHELCGNLTFPGVPKPKQIVGFFDPERGEQFIAINESGVYPLTPAAASSAAAGAAGGVCACVSCERLVSAKDFTVRWSKPLSPHDWTQNLQDAGFLDLPSASGKILFMSELNDKVYLLRERGMDELNLRGNTLAFRAESVPYPGGRVIENSAALCGGKIVFAAENGLYSFDGVKIKRLSECGFFEILPEKGITAVCSAGIYYAAVVCKDGENRIWAVDPVSERGHFLRMKAEMLAGGEELLALCKGSLYAFEKKGLPAEGRGECVLVTERSLLGLSPRRKYLDGVTIQGEGTFRLEARAEKGAVRAVVGEAGKRLLFPVPVTGTSFSFHITTASEKAKLKSLTFELREETGEW